MRAIRRRTWAERLRYVFYVQTKDILDTVSPSRPPKWNAVRPQSSALGAMFQLIVPLLVLMGAFYLIMRSMSGSRSDGRFHDLARWGVQPGTPGRHLRGCRR